MSTYKLYYIEPHSDIEFWSKQPGTFLLNVESDGWGEFEHRVMFEASNDEEAQAKAYKLYDGSSGVYNLYRGTNLIGTEE